MQDEYYEPPQELGSEPTGVPSLEESWALNGACWAAECDAAPPDDVAELTRGSTIIVSGSAEQLEEISRRSRAQTRLQANGEGPPPSVGHVRAWAREFGMRARGPH